MLEVVRFAADAFDIKLPNDDDKMTLDFCMDQRWKK